MKTSFYIFVFSLMSFFVFGQEAPSNIKVEDIKFKKNTQYDPLRPSKAAFYSLVFPGAGQIYNNRYWWQLPLIYGGLGFSIYSYIDNNNEFNRFRDAFRQRNNGLPDEFTVDGVELISDAGLENAQEQFNSNRNFSLLSAVIIYALQIVEASVRAHLLQFETTNDLSLAPTTIIDNTNEAPKVGLTLKYSF